jgi:AcrR family transcriptional regulator
MSTEPGRVAPAPALDRTDRRRREILDAAIKCIRRFGARKVAVEDIAEAAGLSRRTLYRFFANRRQIMQAVVIERLGSVAAGVKAALRLCDGFEESVVVGTVETIRLARTDRIYQSIVDEDRTLTLDDEPADPEAPLQKLTDGIWAEVFAAARRDGKLRSTITDQEALAWLVEVHRLFDLRHDLTDEDIAGVLRRFVLPSLVPDDRLAEAVAGRRAGPRAGGGS